MEVCCRVCGKPEDLGLPLIDGVCYECTRVSSGTSLANSQRRRVAFRVFESAWASWHELFEEAATFASEIEQPDLISISHTLEGPRGIVTVWYWQGAKRGDDRNG